MRSDSLEELFLAIPAQPEAAFSEELGSGRRYKRPPPVSISDFGTTSGQRVSDSGLGKMERKFATDRRWLS